MRRDDAFRLSGPAGHFTHSEDKTNPARRNAPARRSDQIFGRILLFTHLHQVASDPMQRGTRRHPGERIQICLYSYFGKSKSLLYQEALSFLFSDLVGRAPDEVRIHRASQARNTGDHQFVDAPGGEPDRLRQGIWLAPLERVRTQRVLTPASRKTPNLLCMKKNFWGSILTGRIHPDPATGDGNIDVITCF